MTGLFGKKGSGKSLLAAYLAESQWRLRGKRGKILYFPDSYSHVHGEAITLAEMAIGSDRMNNSIMIWDEAQIILNKFRSSSVANRALIAFLTQVRKRGVFLYYTSNAPKQLDRALNEQTDLHAYCRLFTDPRCRRFRSPAGGLRHLIDCRDFMTMNWVDTQGSSGFNPAVKDGRLRKPEKLLNLVQYYRLYNTLAQVSQDEIDAVTREALADARETVETGMSFDDFLEQMREMIVYVVQKYKSPRLIVSTFAKTIKEDLNVDVSTTRVGMACQALGLKRHRMAQGNWYEMPDPDTLHLWRRGLA